MEKCFGIDHLDINVFDIKISGPFYHKLMEYFGFKTLKKSHVQWIWHNGGKNTFGIYQTEKKYQSVKYHRRQIGLNHLAFRAKNKKDVDDFYLKFLVKHKISILYGGPKQYPEYYKNYYAVYFEDPDRIKLEFMWLHK